MNKFFLGGDCKEKQHSFLKNKNSKNSSLLNSSVLPSFFAKLYVTRNSSSDICFNILYVLLVPKIK